MLGNNKLSTSSEALRKILVKGQQVYSWQTGTFASQIHKKLGMHKDFTSQDG